MARDNVNISLNTVDKSSAVLDNIIEKLEKIQQTSNIELGKDSKAVKEMTQEVEKVKKAKKETAEISKKDAEEEYKKVTILKLQKKEQEAMFRNRKDSLGIIRNYITEVQNGNKLSKEQLAILDKVTSEDKIRIQGAKEINSEINKTKKQLEDVEKSKRRANELIKEQQSWLQKQLITISKIGQYEGYSDAQKLVEEYTLQLNKKKELTKEQQIELTLATQKLSLAKQQSQEQNKIKMLKEDINKSEISTKKQFIERLKDLEKKAIGDNFKHEMEVLRKLFKEEEENIKRTAKLNQELGNKQLTAQLSGKSAAVSGSVFDKEAVSRERLVTELKKAQNAELNRSEQILQGLIKAHDQKYLVTKKNLEAYKNINAEEILHKKALNETVVIKNKLNKLNTENKNSLNQLESQVKSSGEAVNDLAGAYIALRAAKAFMSEIKRDIRLLADIDQSLFNLGVVAGKTTTEIEKMKIDFLALGATIPISAIKLADATDILARSGLEYIDAIQTMRAGAELAVAAGEDIADVSRIKIMFSLNSSNCWKPLRVA